MLEYRFCMWTYNCDNIINVLFAVKARGFLINLGNLLSTLAN